MRLIIFLVSGMLLLSNGARAVANEIIRLECKQNDFNSVYEFDFKNKIVNFLTLSTFKPTTFEYDNNSITFFTHLTDTTNQNHFTTKRFIDRKNGNMINTQYALNDKQFNYVLNIKTILEIDNYLKTIPSIGTENFLCERSKNIKRF